MQTVERAPAGEPLAGRGRLGGIRYSRVVPEHGLLGTVTGWNAWSLRASLQPVSYTADASVHERMVSFATALIERGRLPFTNWFPFTAFGSAQYLHYQSLPSVLTGLVGTITGPDVAFRWSLFLLLALWPLAVYSSARVWGIGRSGATVAAVMSPFVASAATAGFERGAYNWSGGTELWTQLFGAWALCYAWALTWRAVTDRRFVLPAAIASGLTVCLHLLSGYLALAGILVIFLVSSGRDRSQPTPDRAGPDRLALSRLTRDRWARGGLVFAGALGASLWMFLPIALSANWSAVNQGLANTPYAKGYGARQELAWLFEGRLFDAGRSWPVITVVVLASCSLALRCWSSQPRGRALFALGAASLMLSFGSTTWGPLAAMVPGHADLYFRRFAMGTQLAGLLLAGEAAQFSLSWAAQRLAQRSWAAWRKRVVVVGTVLALCAALIPAWSAIRRDDNVNASEIAGQMEADRLQGRYVNALVRFIQDNGGGRVYAGLDQNWGGYFTVGAVPVFRYLETSNLQVMAYIVPSQSLMLEPQNYFDQTNRADYSLFGVRWILATTSTNPPVAGALRRLVRGTYALWELPSDSYADPVTDVGTVDANRADVGTATASLLADLAQGQDYSVRWPSGPPVAPVQDVPRPGGLTPPGTVKVTSANFTTGRLVASVWFHRRGTVVFSVTYDPGWKAVLDGKPVRTYMMAPALEGVPVPSGRHLIVLTYHGFSWYPELAGASVLSLAGTRWLSRRPLLGQGP